MDLSSLPPLPESPTGLQLAPAGMAEEESFRSLLGQLGAEVAMPMTNALERVNGFATTGRVDRAGLRALREEIERARRLGLSAQQISRFSSGRVRQKQERLSLTQMLRDALAQRSRETASRGIDLHHELKPVEVVADASMCSALLQAVLDWSFEHARSHIEFRIDIKPWPVHARLSCRFAYIPADEIASASPDAAQRPDSVAWHLLRRLATCMGLQMQREQRRGSTQLVLEFPQTMDESVTTLTLLELDAQPGLPPNSQPMVGRHVLVIASRRETRNAVRETLRTMGLMIDYVSSIDEAREFCSGGLPHAIVFEAALAGEHFHALRADWSREVPSLAFIEITEQGRELEVTDLGGRRTSRVGRDALASALPSALSFELARAL